MALKLIKLTSVYSALPLNPQPLPPGIRSNPEVGHVRRDAELWSLPALPEVDRREALNPQPLPPRHIRREADSLSSQPLPPGHLRREADALNPQPLPPVSSEADPLNPQPLPSGHM